MKDQSIKDQKQMGDEENYVNVEDDWKKDFENLQETIKRDQMMLEKEFEDLTKVLNDLKKGK